MIVRSCGEWRVSLRSGVACLISISMNLPVSLGEKGRRSAFGVRLEADVTVGELLSADGPAADRVSAIF